ncbi:MAG: RagB/SusD family nutrient uptake outer membrane protein [Bacteroidales bacterium]|nr:RagB/SusD family nutrient uptake outer membrane protein [Bacteroidales bacterium]
MRKFFGIFIIALTIAACGSMETHLLSTDNIGKSTIESFITELEGYKAVGEGMHTQLRKFYNDTYLSYGDIMGDMLNITSEADAGEYYLFNYAMDPSYISTYPRTIWSGGWEVITEVNNLLYYGPKVRGNCTLSADKATVDKIMAQAFFTRALVMHDLCNCYAQPYNYSADHSHVGIPILTHVPAFDEELSRKTVAEVYSQILSDLDASLKMFGQSETTYPDGAQANSQSNGIRDCYHSSYIAAEALLARVYLYMGNWEKAKEYSADVMAKVSLSPRNEYIAMFRQSQDNPGTESILRLNAYASSSSISSKYDPTRSSYDFYPCPSFANFFEVDDIRKSLLTYVPEENEDAEFQGKTFPAVCKWLPLKSISDDYKRVPDIFVFRVSEMYLIHAEACANTGDLATAESDLRKLIARARGVPESNVPLVYSGAEGMNNLIARERMKELCFEGHRIFDILRRGQNLERTADSNSSVKEIKYPDYRFVLPIDQMEMQSNELMTQNEGYPKYNGR